MKGATAFCPFRKVLRCFGLCSDEAGIEEDDRATNSLACVTWNIAAVNNNPFEYYYTIDWEPGYEELMLAVERFIDAPGERDVAVAEIFTPAMFCRLKAAMDDHGWPGTDRVEELWLSDFSKRTIVNGFLKDKELGSKRLASFPDRFTNTINCADGGVKYRPTVINNYQQEMRDLDSWFEQWFEFMFETEVSVRNKQGVIESKKVCDLLQPIKRSKKYHAITEDEEAISIPLQVLAQAIFDAVLVHIMNACTPASLNWHELKLKLCSALVVNKQTNVIHMLAEQSAYSSADIIFLQECAGSFVEAFTNNKVMNSRFALLMPKAIDYVRDQNSLILIDKNRLAGDSAACAEELDVSAALASDVPAADGDICAFEVSLKLGSSSQKVILASFHGDTAGIASTPFVDALRKVAKERGRLPILSGLDANTHKLQDPQGTKKFVGEFLADIARGEDPLIHSWPGEDPGKWLTTFNARTFLQPQLNKAVRFHERKESKTTDCNPKDFILASDWSFDVVERAMKDNTGKREYIEGMDFPTLAFPSDHAIVRATVEWKGHQSV